MGVSLLSRAMLLLLACPSLPPGQYFLIVWERFCVLEVIHFDWRFCWRHFHTSCLLLVWKLFAGFVCWAQGNSVGRLSASSEWIDRLICLNIELQSESDVVMRTSRIPTSGPLPLLPVDLIRPANEIRKSQNIKHLVKSSQTNLFS